MISLKYFDKEVVLKDVLIRNAKLQDIDKMHEVLEQAFEGLRGRRYSAQAIEAAIVDAKEIKNRIRSGAYVLVAELDDEIIGTVTGFEEHKSMRVCSLAVHPKYQNWGVARQLMNHLERIAHDKHYYRLFLHTAQVMKEAIHLYESLGYIKQGCLRRHFHGEDFIIFSKLIRRSPSQLFAKKC